MDNWVLIIVLVIFLICIVVGILRGFLRIGVSLLAMIVSIALMIIINPLISNFLMHRTPLGGIIEGNAQELFIPELTIEEIAQLDLTGTPFAGMNEEQLRNQNINPAYLKNYGITQEIILETLGDFPLHTQRYLIETAPISNFMQEMLLEHNDGYRNGLYWRALEAQSFAGYVGNFLARMTLRVISFLISFVLAFVIVRALSAAIAILGDLPTTGILNRIGGGILGVAVGVIIVWLGFLGLSLLYATELGMLMVYQIEQSDFLMYLYENNMIMNRLLAF